MEALLARTKRKLVSNITSAAADSASASSNGEHAPDAAAVPAAAVSSAPAVVAPPKSKYMRRGDVQKVLESAGVVEPLIQLPAPAPASSASSVAAAAASSSTSSSSAPMPGLSRPLATGRTVSALDGSLIDPASIDVREIKYQLRLLGEPITLFGEGPLDRFERFKAVQLRRLDRSGAGQANQMQLIRREIERGVEEQLASKLHAGPGAHADASAGASSDYVCARGSDGSAVKGDKGSTAAGGDVDGDGGGDDDGGDSDDDEFAGSGSGSGPGSGSASTSTPAAVSRDDKYSEDRPRAAFGGSDARWIGFALKRWLHLWERDLAARPTAVAAGVLGQQEAAKHSQTRQYLRPLFAGLKKRTLESDIVEMVAKILGLAQEREYLKAHEEYLVLSIGNAAWPMGVANVGIHARAGRERLASNQTAHVMNDETKRKYIQALKRLLTYAQDKCPTVPSKMFVL